MALTAKKALAIANQYTDDTVIGGGAIKGKNCTIDSIEPISGGQRVTFKWTLDDGTEQTTTMDVMNGVDGQDGQDGQDGKGIKSVAVNEESHLIITYTDDTTYDAGAIEVHSAVDSVNGKTGEVELTASDVGALPDDTEIPSKTSDLTNDSNFVADANYVHTDNNYDDTAKGIVDGVTTALAGKVDKETGKSLIDLTTVVDGASYDSTNHLILFKNGTTTLFSLDAAAFVKDGMVDTVSITGGNLVITFNTDAGKQAISIPLTDIFDPANYYDKTATDGLLADKVSKSNTAGLLKNDGTVDTTTYATKASVDAIKDGQSIDSFADVETALGGKADKVTSAVNGNFAGFDANGNLTDSGKKASDFGTADEIADIVNVYGAKNLMETTASSHTQNGITKTVNADGSFTLNGTATDNTYFYWIGQTQFPTENIQYTYSIETSAVWGIGKAIAGIDKRSETAYIDRYKSLFADGKTHIEGTFTGESGYYAWAWIFIPKGTQLTDVIVKGMIRLASIKDDTFVPYAKTNGALTIDKAEQAEVNDIVNVYGAKNLIPFPYSRPSGYTNYGMTATYDEDGVITVNKITDSATAYFSLYSSTLSPNVPIFLEVNKDYILSLEIEDATDVSIYINDGSTDIAFIRHVSTGKYEYSFTTPATLNSLSIGLYWINTATETNAKVKPMLRLASIEDDTYVPYVPTNKELMSCKLNGYVGAKNLLAYPYKHTTKSENGVTFTDNGDGTITVNTPTSASAETTFYLSQSIQSILDTGTYILSGCPSGGNRTSGYFMEFAELATSSSNWKMFGADTGEGAIAHIDSTRYAIHAYIRIRSGATVSNLTFKPMIRRVEDTDPTYQPYAMTNKELTENIINTYQFIENTVLQTTSGTWLTCMTDVMNLLTDYQQTLASNEFFKIQIVNCGGIQMIQQLPMDIWSSTDLASSNLVFASVAIHAGDVQINGLRNNVTDGLHRYTLDNNTLTWTYTLLNTSDAITVAIRVYKYRRTK